MSFVSPYSTLGGRTWWQVVEESEELLAQQHRTPALWWGSAARVVVRESGLCVAEAANAQQLAAVWEEACARVECARAALGTLRVSPWLVGILFATMDEQQQQQQQQQLTDAATLQRAAEARTWAGAVEELRAGCVAAAWWDARDAQGRSALHAALETDARPLVRRLLAQGAELHTATLAQGLTPAHAAAQFSPASLLPLLERHAFAAQVTRDGASPLLLLARHPWGPVVEAAAVALVERGCPVMLADASGASPLSEAAARGSTGWVTWLLARGAPVTEVAVAAAQSFPAVAALLLQHQQQQQQQLQSDAPLCILRWEARLTGRLCFVRPSPRGLLLESDGGCFLCLPWRAVRGARLLTTGGSVLAVDAPTPLVLEVVEGGAAALLNAVRRWLPLPRVRISVNGGALQWLVGPLKEALAMQGAEVVESGEVVLVVVDGDADVVAEGVWNVHVVPLTPEIASSPPSPSSSSSSSCSSCTLYIGPSMAALYQPAQWLPLSGKLHLPLKSPSSRLPLIAPEDAASCVARAATALPLRLYGGSWVVAGPPLSVDALLNAAAALLDRPVMHESSVLACPPSARSLSAWDGWDGPSSAVQTGFLLGQPPTPLPQWLVEHPSALAPPPAAAALSAVPEPLLCWGVGGAVAWAKWGSRRRAAAALVEMRGVWEETMGLRVPLAWQEAVLSTLFPGAGQDDDDADDEGSVSLDEWLAALPAARIVLGRADCLPGGRAEGWWAEEEEEQQQQEHGSFQRDPGLVVAGPSHPEWATVQALLLAVRLRAGEAALVPPTFLRQPSVPVVSPLTNGWTVTDPCPLELRRVRDLCGVPTDALLRWLGPCQLQAAVMGGRMGGVQEVPSRSRSGSLFFRSLNGAFLVKTLAPPEDALLAAQAAEYADFLERNPTSALPRLLMLLRLHSPSGRTVSFVVMRSVFGGPVRLQYDLKGSAVARRVGGQPDRLVARKDLDLEGPLCIGPRAHGELLATLERDTHWLWMRNICDYSLLVGIRDGHHTHSAPVLSYHSTRGPPQTIYVGLIDTLTQYDMRKRGEHVMKSIVHDASKISAVEPTFYRFRFLKYISSIIE